MGTLNTPNKVGITVEKKSHYDTVYSEYAFKATPVIERKVYDRPIEKENHVPVGRRVSQIVYSSKPSNLNAFTDTVVVHPTSMDSYNQENIPRRGATSIHIAYAKISNGLIPNSGKKIIEEVYESDSKFIKPLSVKHDY
jgi:hypothetical protein